MIEIPLTHGKVALVDDCDAHLAKLTWHAFRSGRAWYAKHTTPRDANGTQHTLYLHRCVLGIGDRSIQVDHVSGDGLDCRRTNLRCSSPAENSLNRRRHRNNRSGYKGVWLVRPGRWQAQIRTNRKLAHLGFFATREDAAHAYDAAALRLHGEFARLNFPGDRP